MTCLESDEQLMVRFKRGNEEVFRELVDRHRKPLMNFFFYSCGDSHLAEDLSQEVFVRLFKASRRYTPSAKFTTFLYTIARNVWFSKWRRVKNSPVLLSLDSGVGKTISTANIPNPRDGLERKQIGIMIQKAVGKLPENLRIVFILNRYWRY